MRHRRITHLHLEQSAEAARASRRLEVLAAGDFGGCTAQLVRIDETHVVLLVEAEDADALAQLDRRVLAPWIAGLTLAEPASTFAGEIVWATAPGDAWAHVDALDDVARCEHFVHLAVETGRVWGLYADTWVRSGAAAGREALPLWPSRELAARCVAGPWSTSTPRAIELAALEDDWLTGMQEDGIVAVITPTPGDAGVLVEPQALADALRLARG